MIPESAKAPESAATDTLQGAPQRPTTVRILVCIENSILLIALRKLSTQLSLVGSNGIGATLDQLALTLAAKVVSAIG